MYGLNIEILYIYIYLHINIIQVLKIQLSSQLEKEEVDQFGEKMTQIPL